MQIPFEIRFTVSLLLAFGAFTAIGFLVYQRFLLDRATSYYRFPGFLTCTLIGQLVALCFFYAVSIPIRTVAFGIGVIPHLIHVTWWISIVGVWGWLKFRGRQIEKPHITPDNLLMVSVFLGILIPTAISFCSTLGGTGHDNHQHAFWSYHIVNSGYVPINARFTEIIEGYPKAFHALVALWLAPGITTLTGPLVRLMPLLQSLLAIGAVIEIFLQSLKGNSNRYVFLSVAAVGYCWLFISGTTLILPFPPYNEGTPRFASACVLFVPVIFALAANLQANTKMHLASIFIAPLSFTLSTAFNPVFSLLWMVCILPACILLWCLYHYREFKFSQFRAVCLLFAVGAVLSSLIMVQDGWFLTQLLDRAVSLRDIVERVTGLMTVGGAVKNGLLPPYVPTIHGEVSPEIDLITLIYNCARGGFWLRAHDSSLFPFIITPFFGTTKLTYVAFLKILSITFLITSIFRFVRKGQIKDQVVGVLISASLLFLVGFGDSFTASILQLTQNKASHFRWLLGEYTVWAGYQLSAVPFALFAISLLWAIVRNLELPAVKSYSSIATRFFLPLIIGIGSAFTVSRFTASSIPVIEGSPRGVLKEDDIKILREFEKLISPGERVILPVNYARGKVAAEERWIGAGAHESAVLYSQREVLFNTFLGAGYTVSWNAVRKYFCTSDIKRREKFIRERRIGKIYFWDSGSGTKEYYDTARICGISLPKIGIKYPPIATKNGHTLYEVVPRIDDTSTSN